MEDQRWLRTTTKSEVHRNIPSVLGGSSPANFTTIKHMALNLIRRAPGKGSFRLKPKIAAWDDEFLASLIAA